jgi:hypothetical protein
VSAAAVGANTAKLLATKTIVKTAKPKRRSVAAINFITFSKRFDNASYSILSIRGD